MTTTAAPGGRRDGVSATRRSSAATWAAGAAAAAGAPTGFSLLPCAPHDSSPHWAATPAWEAACLLTTDSAGAVATNGPVGTALFAAGARQLWFAASTPYTGLSSRRHDARDLVKDTLSIAGMTSDGGESDDAVSHETVAQARRIADEMAANLQAGWWGLRLFAWGLSWLYKVLFSQQVWVDLVGLERLSQMSDDHLFVFIPTHKSHIDYLTMSYVLFAAGFDCPHIAAGENLALPVAGSLLRHGGAFFIRRSPKDAPDSELYKQVLAAYVAAVLRSGHSLEFFIEGGRSRDGAVQKPRLGLLGMVVGAVLAGHTRKAVSLVPVSISYDAPLEERAMAAEVAGRPKAREDLPGLLRAAGGLLRSLATHWVDGAPPGAGGKCGCASIAFGTPLSVKRFLKDRARHKRKRRGAGGSGAGGSGAASPRECAALDDGSDSAHGGGAGGLKGLADAFPKGSVARRSAVDALGEEVAARLRGAAVLPASSVLVLALQHAVAGRGGGVRGKQDGLYRAGPWLGAGEVAASVAWVEGEVGWRGGRAMSITHAAQPAQLLERMARLMHACVEVEPRTSAGEPPRMRAAAGPAAALARHYRANQLLPLQLPRALLAAAMAGLARRAAGDPSTTSGHQLGWVPEAAVLSEALWLRRQLAVACDLAAGACGCCSSAELAEALESMREEGAALRLEGARGPLVRLAGRGGGAAAAAFAAGLLAPLLATHAAVAALAADALSAAPDGLPPKQLLRHVMAGLGAGDGLGPGTVSGIDGGAARRPLAAATLVRLPCEPLPSVLVVQAALDAGRAEGLMAVAVEGRGSPMPLTVYVHHSPSAVPDPGRTTGPCCTSDGAYADRSCSAASGTGRTADARCLSHSGAYADRSYSVASATDLLTLDRGASHSPPRSPPPAGAAPKGATAAANGDTGGKPSALTARAPGLGPAAWAGGGGGGPGGEVLVSTADGAAVRAFVERLLRCVWL